MRNETDAAALAAAAAATLVIRLAGTSILVGAVYKSLAGGAQEIVPF
jgi:hypothetical protein